jgi:hypothetical protein
MKTSEKHPSRKRESRKKSSRAPAWLLVSLPPAITGILGIVGTLFATGTLPPHRQEGTTATASTSAPRAPVLDAPFLYFSSQKIDYSLPDCMTKAKAELERLKLTGSEARGYIAWGYQDETTGLVWCNTDEKMVIYLAAGRSDQKALELAEALRKSF